MRIGVSGPTFYDFFVEHGHPSPWPAIGEGDCVPLSRTSAESLEHTRNWINQCLSQHEKCRLDEPSFLPTRVLDLGAPQSSLDAPIKLIEPESGTEDPYVCLSHCWGHNGQTLTTTTDNILDRKTSIPLDSLPPLFKDVVQITRRLGYQYLWIDSLCILQNSEKDWEWEACRMATVYSNAIFTIAALSASCSQECLSYHDENERRKLGLDSLERFGYQESSITVAGADSNSSKVYVRAEIPHVSGPVYNHQAENWPLLTRGWAYQERRLSGRILKFSKRELLWECSEHKICQCTDSQPPSLYKLWYNKAMKIKGSWHDSIGIQWRQMVIEYTALELTQNSDRLPAFRGIARQMSRFFPCGYLDGIWEGPTLIPDLMWMRSYNFEPGPPRPTHRFHWPSWSWASVDGPIDYYSFRDDPDFVQPMIDIIDCCSAYNPIDERYPLCGWIRVAAHMEARTWRVQIGTGEFWKDARRGGHYLFPRRQPFGARAEDDVELNNSMVHHDYDWSAESIDQISESTVLHLAKIAIVFHDLREEERECALLLRKKPGREDTYQRVGLVHVGIRPWRGAQPPRLKWEEQKTEITIL
ncbi:HET-domain-containing protein [Mytilinidion resinicola]|uniref:HET-domain-containing protein n=1 Tax=Mytilinidion resinicola TaxID=574789 RepID=A0A6A6XYJ2_9PEZI|nr:HET-domain-containing protein [Mytilinidion resinicola]KAF2801490.1 HET-domain-containing protein [Mytilinidion resinicola]